MVVVVMGVAGSGKSAVGRRLAQALGLLFIEGDDFHEPLSVEKMHGGEPLSNDDRGPWLRRLNDELRRSEAAGAVLACSALTAWSRQRLTDGVSDVRFVFLHGPKHVLRQRLEERTGHFAGAQLLDSQLDALEPPDGALTIDVDAPLDLVVSRVLAGL